jgi:hypothetical protein
MYDYGQEEDTVAVTSETGKPEIQYTPDRPSHVNAREYRVKRYQQIPPIQETKFYVKKVLSYYHAFRSAKNRPTAARSQF